MKEAITKIKRWLGLEQESNYATDQFDFTNMRTSIFMSCVIIALEVWMIFGALYGTFTGIRVRTSGWIAGHLAMYLTLIAAAVTVLVYSVKNLKKQKNRHFATATVFMVFSLICIVFGIYISNQDYIKGEQLFTFTSLVIIAVCLVVWRPFVALLITIPSFLMMYFLMVRADGASYATRVNFLVQWICVFLCAVGNYGVRMQLARQSESLKKSNEQLIEKSYIDDLTGLRNRSAMRKEALELIGRQVMIFMIDVDNFKYINDTYNHVVGDEVLVRIADMIRESFSLSVANSKTRWLNYYRFGGDGFILLVSGYPEKEIFDKIRALQEMLHAEQFEGTDIVISISCGVITGLPQSPDDLKDMVRYSDHTLYEAKRIGHMQMLTKSLEHMRRLEKSGKLGKRFLTNHETDPLTGLPNMLYFRSHAGKELARAAELGDPSEFLYFDIVNFKEFNETHGFQMGDQLLKTIAERLEEVFENALTARVSDDHFIVFTLDAKYGNPDRLQAVRETLEREKRGTNLQLKVGVYQPVRGETDASLACDRARIACASIKHRFDEYYRVYDRKIEDEEHRRQYIVNNIDIAIRQGYIQVYYQPIVQLSDDKICNLEALARWDDPVYGLLPPGVFIDVLEEYHLIHKLDLCMAEQVCRNMHNAKAFGLKGIPVSLNFSRRDFEVCDMVEELARIAGEYAIPHHLLEIEITESALTNHPELLDSAMRRFKEKGFKLWLDDFGSGYSSLNVLKSFPFDVLKIDMTFLRDFDNNDKTRPILSNIVHMADDLEILALSEGVETDEQRSFLKSIGCERAQGYFFGKPMKKEDLRSFIESGQLTIADHIDFL
ncbi:MAG: bifunctional diguanylate cyclase/phosphodiesterase [Lachnospiraceae bacterium]|nr:bifunctional diguanylate cyclase/phosphodiesterase [Lachnospiraceae bacterium]